MPDADYERCHFSVTCHTDDLAVVHCLRSLAQYAERSNIPKNIPWGGTKESEWRKAGQRITFRFTSPAYRDGFVEEALRLLPRVLWSEVGRNDADPATRQR